MPPAMTRYFSLTAAGLVIFAMTMVNGRVAGQGAKQSIAHRGASAYAPEHTPAAYRLALEQKVDFVEPDLAVTKDGVLVCLHDDTLERTTNIAQVFSDRPSANVPG